MPSLLVVSPSLNQGQYIEQMIRSVISQLDDEDRFVVVDAGSTDSTPEVLSRFEQDISLIEVAPLKQAPAIRWGMERFDTDLCCYLNTDDLLLPGAVSRVKSYFANHQHAGAVYSHRVFLDDNAQVDRVWHLPTHRNALMGRWDYIPQETCFWRRSAMDAAGGIDPNYDFAMDYDFFCRLMATSHMHRLNDYLAAFRVHGQSKTSNFVDTIGADEVAHVRAKYGYSTDGLWRAVGKALRHYVEFRSQHALTDALRSSLQYQVNESVGANQ